MKSTLMKTLLCAFAMVILFSCNSNKNDEILNFTTDTTLGISRVNLKELSKKIPVDKILKEKKNVQPEEKLFLQLVSKPEESGIDIDKPLYIIVDQGKTNSEFDAKSFLWINDKAKFQKSMSEMTKSKVTIDSKDQIFIDGKLAGSMKGEMAIMVSEKAYNPYGGYNSDMSQGSERINAKYFTDFWARKGSKNAAIKEQVNNSLVADKDVSGWVNLAAVASFASKGYIETLAINKLIKDSGIGFDFNFDKGKAEMETKTFFNSDMKKIVEKYYDKNDVNYDLVKNVELDNAKSFSIGFFSLDFMKYLVKEAGFEATVNHYLASSNKSLEDITSTFTGDYAFVDFKVKQDTADYYNYRSDNAIVLGFNPKNKATLTSLMDQYLTSAGKKYMVTDNQVIVSDNPEVLSQFQSKKAGKNSTLDKKSGVMSYSWSDGKDYNQRENPPVKVISMTNESKEDGGNLVSKSVFTLDKKDENALYYLLMND